MAAKKLNNLQKTAALLTALGQDVAADIFRHLGRPDAERIAQAMSRLGRLEQDTIDEILLEFHSQLQNAGTITQGGPEFTAKVLQKAFSGSEAEQISEDIGLDQVHSLTSLSRFDSKSLANLIANEHPQTAAVIVAHLEPKAFADVIKLIPVEMRSEIMARVASLEPIDPDTLEQLEEALQKELTRSNQSSQLEVDGVQKIAEMLNKMDKESADTFLAGLRERDPDTAARVDELRFTFDDLAKVHDQGIQEILKNIPLKTLAIALKKCDDRVKKVFVTNLSSRGAEMLEDDIEALPPMRMSDVEESQAKIVEVARELEAQGVITMSGDDQFV